MSEAASAEEAKDANAPEAIASRTAELRRRALKDLLVQEEVSDSDMEMFEKQSDDGKNEAGNEDASDPEMCVECGDQVWQ
jgi:hypothetical protein